MTNKFNATSRKRVKRDSNSNETTSNEDEYINPSEIYENKLVSPLLPKSDLNPKKEKGVSSLSIIEKYIAYLDDGSNLQQGINSASEFTGIETNGILINTNESFSLKTISNRESAKFEAIESEIIVNKNGTQKVSLEDNTATCLKEDSVKETIVRKKLKITTNITEEIHESCKVDTLKTYEEIFAAEKKGKKGQEKFNKIKLAKDFINETQKLLQNGKNTHFINSLLALNKEDSEEGLWLKIENIQRLIKDSGNLLKFYTFMPLLNLKQVLNELCSCNECHDKIGSINILDFAEDSHNSNIHACRMFIKLFNLYLNSKISSVEILKYVYSLITEKGYKIVKQTLAKYIYLYTPFEEIIGSYVYDKISNKCHPKVEFKSTIPTKTKEKQYLEDTEDEFFSFQIENDRLLFYKKFIKQLLKGKTKQKAKILIFSSSFKLITDGDKLLNLFIEWNTKRKDTSFIKKLIRDNENLLKTSLTLINKTIRDRNTSPKMENLKKNLKTLQFKAAKPTTRPRYIPRNWMQEDNVCKIIKGMFETQIVNFIKEKFPGEKNLTNLKKLLNFFNCEPSNFNISKKEFDAFLHLSSYLYAFGNVKISNPDLITPLYRNLTSEEFNELFIKIETFLGTRFGKEASKYEELYTAINTQYNYTSAPIIFYKVKFDFLIRNKISTLKEGKSYVLTITEKDTIFPGCSCCLNQKMRIYKVKEVE